MAYNRRNLLLKIVEIQEITLEHTGRGVSQEWLFDNVIQTTYHISRGTYYRYLAINAKREITRMDSGEIETTVDKAQMKLF